MYCSSCGVAISQTLTFCNHCGAKVGPDESLTKPSELKPDTLVRSIGSIFICGLAAMALFLGVCKAVIGLDWPIILALAMLAFLMMFSIEGVLIWMLVRGQRRPDRGRKERQLHERPTTELEGRQLQALPEPRSSVTDHTTRAFDPVYAKRTSNE